MASTQILESKNVSETINLRIDASGLMDTGEAITAVLAYVVVWSGTDPNPSAILSGSPTVLTNVIRQNVIGGVAGVTYMLRFDLTTNQGNQRILTAPLSVLSQ